MNANIYLFFYEDELIINIENIGLFDYLKFFD